MNNEELDVIERILIPYVKEMEEKLLDENNLGEDHLCRMNDRYRLSHDCIICNSLVPNKHCSMSISEKNDRYIKIKKYLIDIGRYTECSRQLEFEF